MINNKKLALIHIVKKELALSDEAYRAILKKVCNVTSAKELNDAGFRKLMFFLARSRYYQPTPGGITLRQTLFIKNLFKQTQWTDSHFHNFLLKYFKKTQISGFSKKEASNLINALQNIVRSQKTKK